MAALTHFSRDLFNFLAELKANNNREWFQDNREQYRTTVQEPLLAFISAMAEPLHAISPNFVADPRPSGGSMFRVYRDVRFSRDKSPYKTHAAAQFRHRAGRDAHAPGFYLHLEPGNVFAGAGLWHPGRENLNRIRDAIDAEPERWLEIIDAPQFRTAHTLGGERLKRPPRGFDADHPTIEHIKRKDFVCSQTFAEEEACAPGFFDAIAASFRVAAPFVRFLTEAVEQPF